MTCRWALNTIFSRNFEDAWFVRLIGSFGCSHVALEAAPSTARQAYQVHSTHPYRLARGRSDV